MVDSQISRGITAEAPSFLSLCGAQGSGPAPAPAVALSVTDAPVPIWVGDPAAGCAGTRFAGGTNLAVTFGANIVSHATVDGNGPGEHGDQGQHRPATLGCSASDPAPINAGQPNTAGSKTGHCSAL